MNLAAALEARGLYWIVPDWPAPPAVRALVTTRNGGFSAGPPARMNPGNLESDAPEFLRHATLVPAGSRLGVREATRRNPHTFRYQRHLQQLRADHAVQLQNWA